LSHYGFDDVSGEDAEVRDYDLARFDAGAGGAGHRSQEPDLLRAHGDAATVALDELETPMNPATNSVAGRS
jgi:hypothetical protein